MIYWVRVTDSIDALKKLIPNGTLKKVITSKGNAALMQYQNEFRAFENLCPHNGAELSKGSLNHKGEVICPLHSYCYNTMSGEESSKKSEDLKIYEIKVDDNGVHIGFW